LPIRTTKARSAKTGQQKVVSFEAVAAFAQGPQRDRDGVRDFAGPGQGLGNGHAYGFVDENGDGVNDRFVDADGDGVCDNVSLGYGRAGTDAPRGQGAQLSSSVNVSALKGGSIPCA
jgi:hypothetical protein